MPLTEAAKAKKKKRDDEAHQQAAKSIVNKTVKAADHANKAVSNNTRQPSVSQKTQSTVERLNQKYGRNQSQPSVSTVRKPSQTSPKAQKTVDRLNEKYGKGKVTGGKHSYMDDVVDTAKSTLRQVAAEEARAFNASARTLTSKDSYLYASQAEIDAANKRADERDKKLRAKIKQESAEMEKFKQGHSYLGQQGLSAVSSAVGMATDAAWGPAALAHMFIRTQAGSEGNVKEKVEPLKQKLSASGNYSQEEIDEMFKDVDKWDLANSIFEGGIEVLSEKMFGGFGLAKRVGGSGILDKSLAKLGARMGSKATTGVLGRVAKGTAEEVAEEEIGNPLQTLASNLIYGNRMQSINEDATRRELQAQSDAIRSRIQTPEDAQAVATQLGSKEFMADSRNMYLESGMSEKEADELASMTRDYLEASALGDVDRMRELQDEMVKKLAGGENSLKEKWTLQDAIDAAVSTSLMTVTTGAPGAVTNSMMGKSYKDTNGMDAVKNLAKVTKNLDPEKSVRAQAIMDRIDAGEDISGTQVYDLIQWSSEAATESYKREDVKERMADSVMKRENLFVAPSVRNEDGSVTLGEETERRYDEALEENKVKAKAVKGISREDAEIAADVATAFQLGTITANQMNELSSDNLEVREAFHQITGINLNQFDTSVNQAENNIAMQESLFARAADNYIESARIEQEAWNDGARGEVESSITEGLGSNGDVAVHDALNAVDPRDRSTFILMGRASASVYDYARFSEDSWEDVSERLKSMYPSLPQDALKGVYESAKKDKKIAETPYYNAKVKATEPTSKFDMSEAEQTEFGKFTNEAQRQLKDSEQIVLQSLAQQFNINIKLLPSKAFKIKSEGKDGKTKVSYSNGAYDPKTGTMILNGGNDMERNLIAVALHEITHHIATYAPEEYIKLSNRVMDRWYKNDSEAFKEAIQQKQAEYKKAVKQDLSEEQALEEIIADAVGEMNSDSKFIEQICREEPTLAEKIINAIKDVLRKLREILSSGRISGEYEDAFFAQLDMWDEAQRLWMQAAKAAQKQRANQAIDEWDANARQNTPEEETVEEIAEDLEPKERFSVDEPVERVKDLIAVHNLKPDDIRNTFDLGGFPMPSIAVTKDSMGHDLYGDITLMFNSNTIDPQYNRSNQVFGGDAWTPTFPAIRYKHNEKVTDKIRDLYYDNANRIGYDAMRPLYDVAVTPEDAINRYGGEQGLKEHFMKDTSIMRTFLKMNDKDVEDVVTRTETTLSDTEQKLRQHMIDSLGEDAVHEWEGVDVPNGSEKAIYRRQWVENHLDEIKDAYKSFMRSGTFHFSEEEVDNVISNMKLIEFVKLMRNASNFLNDGATTVKEEVDRKATDERVKIAAQENGYGAWVNSLLDGIEEKQGIRNDKDAFTRQGNRRSWESLHEPVTLENVVKVMRSELAAGGNGIVGANPKGAAQKNYKNLDEIRSDEDRLQQLPEEEFKELEGSATQKLVDVCQDIVDSNPKRFDNKFGATLDVGEYVAEILNETRDKSSIHKRLQKDYALKVTDEQMDALMGAIDEIANLPTGYFEAKPRRAVGFDEVKAAIIPSTIDEDIKQGFNDRGIQMYEYDPDVEGDRTEKINEAATAQDLRFSINEDSSGKELTVGQKEFFRYSKIVDDEGRLKVMYHGTPNKGFTIFDLKKAHPGTLGRGFYFTDSDSHAANHGERYEVYLNIENPLETGTQNITKDQLRSFVEAIADDEDYGIENYGYGATVDSVTDDVWGKSDFQMLHDLNLTCVGDLAEAVKLFNEVNGTNYDGIVTEVETLAMYPDQIKLTVNENPSTDPDIRYSITPEMDDEYMEAVNSNNMEEAQRLVDEAAGLAGFNTDLYHGTRDFGFTQIKTSGLESKSDGGYYEWSPFFATDSIDVAQTYSSMDDIRRINEAEEPFDEEEFDAQWHDALADIVSSINRFAGIYNYMDYTDNPFAKAYKELQTTSHSAEDALGEISEYVLPDIISEIAWMRANDEAEANPDEINDVSDYADEIQEGEEAEAIWMAFDRVSNLLRTYYDNNYGNAGYGNYALKANTSNMMKVDAKGVKWNQIPASALTDITGEEQSLVDYVNTRTAAAYARDHGYDGIQISNLYDDGGKGRRQQEPATIYIFFKPESQVRSADPVTYAEDGSVIPLSERFDPGNDDIRYSLPTQDSDGNILSNGQMEFFKNSQARDKQGRLVPVYHTTPDAGFTVFDSENSGDGRSLFFTNNRAVSASYSNASGALPTIFDPYEGTAPKRTVSNVENLPEDILFGDGLSKISNIKVMDSNGREIAAGDDFVNVAIETGRYLESQGYDLYDDFDVDSYLVSDSTNMGNKRGEAMDLYRNLGEGNFRFTMDYSDQFATYAVYLNLENPLRVDADNSDWNEIPFNGESYNTRELAKLAQDQGHDGVIIENVVDYGDTENYGDRPADVYIAFNSNQIKDTRNTDPTNNPDIRFSITNDDEAMSKAAESDAWDNSVEALAYYESMISDIDGDDDGFINHPMQVYLESLKKYGESDEKARNAKNKYKYRPTATIDNEEELINKFYAGLTAFADGMRFEDPVLEEGRVRLAKSKNDFMERLNAEWNENWLTEGEVLDIKSVKAEVRQLVMSVMRNSDTDKQFKTDVVNKTLIDIRLAYQFAKKGRIDVADALIWHSALRMIENVEFVQDDTFNDYKDLRDYLKTTRISLGPEYWSDVNFGQFRKDNFGRLKLVKGDTNVDDVYMELSERWPEWFDPEEELTPPDMLEQIAHVLDVIKPYKEAYSSEAAAEIATDIAYDLSDIVYGKGKPYESIADKYKNRYEAKTKAMKQRHEEALRKVKEQRDKGIKAERAKWHVREEQRKERTLHKRYYDSITRSYNKLYERLTTNTKDKHIPEQYKRDLAELLSAFDLQTVASKKVEKRRGVPGKKTIKMSAIRTVLKNIASKNQLFYINDTITDIMEELLGDHADGSYSRSIEGISVDELNSEELKKIDKLLKSLIHEFNVYESVRVGAKRQQAADIGSAQVDSCLAHAGKFGEGKDYQNFLGALDKVLNLDELTPAYLFRQIDPSGNGLGIMFRELRRSFDKYIRNQNQLNEWMNEILGQYHNNGKAWNKYGANSIEEWRSEKNAVEIHLANGTITVTPAQMMSIYCLQKRQQAYSHMTGAGVVIQPVSFQAKMTSDLLKKANYALPVILTDDDIKLIVSKLTKEQVDVADKLQSLMADKMAAWGNEASMAVLGIRLFEDPDYFPIKSDKAALEKDFSAEQFVEAIRNFGFTKAVQPGARNAIAVGDIFDVVAEHCNNMNLYNAYSEAMNDFMKVYNYHEYKEDGSDYSVEQAIAHAYSRKATTFIMTFMKDLNGNVSRERTTGIEAMMNDSLGKAKKASVFANGRVALQQPTALTRAFYVISPKYMNLKISKASLQEMFDHCPIALWKSWGYYDINMGKSIEDLMMNNGSWLDDKFSDIYGQLDNRTWAVIWNMCKAETEDLHPELKKGTEEYWEAVNARMTEVVDLTQVVDSPFHRSHAMRSKNTLVKMATAFMAEPTLTFNMVRDGLRRAHEAYKSGNKTEAGKIAGKTARIFVVSAFTTAAFAAVWDVIRDIGKGDDDEDKKVFDLWWTECMENLKDNINLLNNIYYVKDLVSLFQGWDQKNLGLQGWKHLADSYRQLTGSYKGYSNMSWWQNALAGVGYLTGIPLKTMMNDGKAIMNIFGIHPRVLDDIADHLDSIQDMLSGQSAGAGVSKVSSSKGSSKKSDKKSEDKGSFVNLWTYDNAPFFVEDGSVADKFLNHFGVNLTAAEIKALEDEEHQREIEKKIADIQEKTADLSGEAKDKKVWSYVTTYLKAENEDKSLSDFIEKGDYRTVNEYRDMYLAAGGREEYFDSRIFASSKKALKLSIISDPTDAQIEQQNRIKDYLLTNGMTEAEMSEIAYKSNTARDLKAAFRLNDRDAMVEELIPLVRAGLTYQDLEKLYKYRNSGRTSYDGKYKDRFKSTGHYNWPITGQITSNFGHRSSPGGIGSTYHQGLDIAGSMGDPVGAADGGTVVYAGWYGGAGKTVMIEHDDGTVTQYSHLSWYDAKVGDVVGQGQTVGNVGSTGNSTGPHLHFAVKVNGKYVDPITYLKG